MISKEFLSTINLPFEKFANQNILITGANGMIASTLAELLYALDEEHGLGLNIYCLSRNKDRAEKRFRDYLYKNNFHLVIDDVVNSLDTGIDYKYIFHVASSANPDAFNNYPVDVMKANFIGTMNMLEYARTKKDCRVVFVSSSEVYGENFEERESFDEDTLSSIDYFRFRACYPESKRASETLCKCYEKQYGVDAVIVRPAFIYGKDIIDDNNRADVYFLRKALNKENIVMYSEGKQVRSYCYVNDCVSAFLYVALLGETGEAYNIGNEDCVVTMKEYAQKVADYGKVKLIYEPESAPENKIFLKTTKLILNTSKLRKLGWNPVYDLGEGMKEIFEG